MKIKVLSSKQTIIKDGKKTTFYRYFSPCNIQTFGKDGEDLGIQLKNIEVHFTKVASKKLPQEKVFAIIESKDAKNISLPYVWKVTTDEETGELVFPQIWVRDFDSYTELDFTSKSTCQPVIDEPSELVEEQDTEEVDLPM